MKYTIINTVLKCIFVLHIIDTVDMFQMCIYDYYMVPKII
jgi:hypothetical protein